MIHIQECAEQFISDSFKTVFNLTTSSLFVKLVRGSLEFECTESKVALLSGQRVPELVSACTLVTVQLINVQTQPSTECLSIRHSCHQNFLVLEHHSQSWVNVVVFLSVAMMPILLSNGDIPTDHLHVIDVRQLPLVSQRRIRPALYCWHMMQVFIPHIKQTTADEALGIAKCEELPALTE